MSVLHKIMLFWAYLVGLGAFCGALMFFIDPSGIRWGMDSTLHVLKNELTFFSPLFQNFIANGIVLLVVIGLPNLISVILTHKKSKYAILSNAVSGCMLTGWALREFYILGYELLSVAYFVFGLLQLSTAIAAYAQKDKLKNTITN